MKRLLIFIISISTVFLAIYSVQGQSFKKVGTTSFWWALNILFLTSYFIVTSKFIERKDKRIAIPVTIYLLWNVFSIVRGFYEGNNYWDYKALANNGMALMLPVVTYIATDLQMVQKIFRTYILVALPLFIFVFFNIATDAVGFYLMPVSIILLFLPTIPNTWKIFIVGISFFVITIDFGARSNFLKFIIPLLFLAFYYLQKYLQLTFFELLRKTMFVIPFVFLILGLTGIYDIFKIDQLTKDELIVQRINAEGEVEEDNVMADTRSFLYEETIQTAQNNNSWWLGRSPARGTETSYFTDLFYQIGKQERYGNEVAILNIFTWTGIIGVFLYFLIFYFSSRLAVLYSNNIFAKILGLFISFRWIYSWIEDVNYFTLNTFCLWLMIGLAFSSQFRRMSDAEIKVWIRGIFYKSSNQHKISQSPIMRII